MIQNRLVKERSYQRDYGPFQLDLSNDSDQVIGVMEDFRVHFHPTIEGLEYLRPLEVRITANAKIHLKKDHPERLTWLLCHSTDVQFTIIQPEITTVNIQHRLNGFYSITFIRKVIDQTEGRFLAVAISLAKMPGQDHSEYHMVTTIYPMKFRDLFLKTGEIKPTYQLLNKNWHP